jgi:hypothetical protein
LDGLEILRGGGPLSNGIRRQASPANLLPTGNDRRRRKSMHANATPALSSNNAGSRHFLAAGALVALIKPAARDALPTAPQFILYKESVGLPPADFAWGGRLFWISREARNTA